MPVTSRPAEARLAMNFLMDRSAENWTRELASRKGQVGDCATDAPITATGALAGRFQWTCERGRLDGQCCWRRLVRRPQALGLRVAPPQ